MPLSTSADVRSVDDDGTQCEGPGYISGSVTVVDNVPRAVAPLNRGNNNQCCEGPPSSGTWKYPCVANPPTPGCQQTYMMSVALDPTDLEYKAWQQLPQQTMLVNYSEGHAGTVLYGYFSLPFLSSKRDRQAQDPFSTGVARAVPCMRVCGCAGVRVCMRACGCVCVRACVPCVCVCPACVCVPCVRACVATQMMGAVQVV